MASWVCDEVESQLGQPDDDDYDKQSMISGAYREGWYAGDMENPMNWSSCKYALGLICKPFLRSAQGRKPDTISQSACSASPLQPALP